MAKIESLTPEQEALCEVVAQEYIDSITSPKRFTRAAIDRWLKIVYGLYDQAVPPLVEIVDSPMAACRIASEMLGEKVASTDYCGVGDGGWVSHYDYFYRIGVLSSEEPDERDRDAVEALLALCDFGRMAWDTVLLDECAIVVRRPVTLRVDDEGNLHCSDGPALLWADGEKEFAHHGVWIPERMVTAPRSYTREEYVAIANTEERRALGEIAGWDWVCSLLAAKPIDEWTDPATQLGYVLLAADSERWLRKISPQLANGTQPVYVEPVHPELKTAAAARKWQAVLSWTPEQCEADPALEYGVEA